MQLRIGCDYISELPFKKKEVWNAMGEMDLSDYRQEQLEDFLDIYIWCELSCFTERFGTEGRFSDIIEKNGVVALVIFQEYLYIYANLSSLALRL